MTPSKETIMDDLHTTCWFVIQEASKCEEIPIAQLREQTEWLDVDFSDYETKWEELCEACYALIAKVEEKMP
jgi:hypothetical protein